MHMQDYFSLLFAIFLVSHLESSVKFLAGEFIQSPSQNKRSSEAATKDYLFESISDSFQLKSSMEASTILRRYPRQKEVRDDLQPLWNPFIRLESSHNNLTLSPTTVLHSSNEMFASEYPNSFPVRNQIRNIRSSMSPLYNVTEKSSLSNQNGDLFWSDHPSLFGSVSSSIFEIDSSKTATTFSPMTSVTDKAEQISKMPTLASVHLKSDEIYPDNPHIFPRKIDEPSSDKYKISDNIYNLQSPDRATVTTIIQSHTASLNFRSPIIQTINFQDVSSQNFTSVILATPVVRSDADFSDSLNSLEEFSAPDNLSSLVTTSVMFSSKTVLATASLNASSNVDVSDPSPNSHVSEARRHPLGTGAIVGITLGAIGVVTLLAGMFGFLIYHWRFRSLSSLESKYPTDNCGYVDDTLRVSYINNHVELPKESSEEMFSLDNDSFLNSLEAMTLQNYWAEDAKNTKV